MKIRYLVLLSYFIVACGAESKPKPQVIDPALAEYFEEFKEDCAKSFRAEACDGRLPWVSRIEFSNDLPDQTVGLATTRYGSDSFEIIIQIRPNTKDLRLVMFHELGHAIGLDHFPNSCIMDKFVQDVEKWGGWEQCKWVFFNVK